VPQGLDLGGNVGLQRGAQLGLGSPVGFMNPPPLPSYPINPNFLVAPGSMPRMSPSQPMPNMLSQQQNINIQNRPFNARDYSTYPNTFDPWMNAGGSLGMGYGLGLSLQAGHAIAPGSAFGYTGCQ